MELLYRATRDGWHSTDFHRLCDDKGPTVIFVKVSNGRLCGGYCSIGWKSSGNFQRDPDSFLFSLDYLKTYSDSSPDHHHQRVYWDINHGFWFGCGGSLGFDHNPLNEVDGGTCKVNAKSLIVKGETQGGGSELTGRVGKFTACEIEVF